MPPPPPIAIDWEWWIGLRGAAVLGGIVLAFAGLLFFRYSIEHGLITPTLRVVIGIATGLGCLVASEWIRTRYRFTTEAVAGAGIVILYSSFWAARARYSLIPLGVAFALMVLVTAACGLLSIRRESQVIAALGLVGGFATPLLLQSDADHPIGLFGYVLLIDLGLLAIGRKLRWPWLGIGSLAGTVLMQVLWIGQRMGPDRALLGLAILAVFAALFALAGQIVRPQSSEQKTEWFATQAGALLVPFVFALYFAGRAQLAPHLYSVGALLLLLTGAASWIGRAQKMPWLGLAAGSGSLAVVGVWLTQRALTPRLAWEAAGLAFLLSLALHLFVEWDRERAGLDGPAPAAILTACGFVFLLVLGAVKGPDAILWPWLAGWVGIAALFYRHATFPEREFLQVVAALGIALGLGSFHIAHHEGPGSLPPFGFMALLVAVSVSAQVAAVLGKTSTVREWGDHAAAALPIVLLVLAASGPALPTMPPASILGGALALGTLAVLSATRLRSGPWYAAAVGATALVEAAWTFQRPGLLSETNAGGTNEALVALSLQTIAVLVFTLWPLFTKSFSSERWAWYAAALAGPAWFFGLRRLFEAQFGDGFIGILPVALGTLSLAALFQFLRGRGSDPSTKTPVSKTALVWFSAVTLCFASVAIPLQLDREWITMGWALEGLAVIALWRRLDHPGLKYFGLALLGGAAVRLVLNPALLGYYPRSGQRIVNWLLYTYLVPAACLLCASALLRDREKARARPWEANLYRGGNAGGSIATAFAGILVIFVWLNLAITDWFATGPTLALDFERRPARDLAFSIAWAVYALVLLGIGMFRGSRGLRWLSLSFLVVTIGKVFLYDVGELKDLYRVASLVGLAVSLILVSLLYQRFVFAVKEKG